MDHICSQCCVPWVACDHDSSHREACPNRPPVCAEPEAD